MKIVWTCDADERIPKKIQPTKLRENDQEDGGYIRLEMI